MIATQTDRRLLGAGAASIGLHGAVAASLFLGIASRGPVAAPPPAAMVVEMVALPSAPPAPPLDAPPEPEQKKAQPQPVPDQPKLPPIPKLALNVKAEVVVPSREKPEEKKEQADKPAEETTHEAAPDAPRQDAARAPQAGAPSNTPSNAEQGWEARVIAALERKKRYPDAAQSAGQQDVIVVRIVLDRQGRVLSSEIRQSQGYALLDGEVAALVRRASPLPKPPDEVAGDRISLLVPVEFRIKHR